MEQDFKIELIAREYQGSKLLDIQDEQLNPIIQDFLYESDYVLLIAKEKMGKSILALQIACCLSSGSPFLDTLEISRPRRVWYFSLEGKDVETRQRLLNMSHKIGINPDNIRLFCSAGLQFNTSLGRRVIGYLVKQYHSQLPEVIIVDPLYMAIQGSIKDDKDVNGFTHTMRGFADICKASVIVVHHAKRPVRGKSGDFVASKGDDEIYGSAFLKASADHIFHMGKVPGSEKRFLRCDTQRSGNIIENFELVLREPDPLYFEQVEFTGGMAERVLELLRNNRDMTVMQMGKLLGTSRVSIYKGLNGLEGVVKTPGKPVRYNLG